LIFKAIDWIVNLDWSSIFWLFQSSVTNTSLNHWAEALDAALWKSRRSPDEPGGQWALDTSSFAIFSEFLCIMLKFCFWYYWLILLV